MKVRGPRYLAWRGAWGIRRTPVLISIGEDCRTSRSFAAILKRIWNTDRAAESSSSRQLLQQRQCLLNNPRFCVEMRRQADTRAALRTDHLLLFQLTEQRRIVPAIQAEGQNSGALLAVHCAVQVRTRDFSQPIQQPLYAFLQGALDRRHAYFFQQRKAGFQRHRTEHVRAAAFKTPSALGGFPAGALVVAGMFEHMPAVFMQLELRTQVAAAIEHPKAFRAEQPFMAVGHGKGALAGLHIEGQGAELLDRIDAQQHAARRAALA